MTERRRLLLCACLAAVPVTSALAEGVEAVTRPSEDVTLSFVRPGRIEKIMVKEGDTVEADKPLAKQDDTADLVQLEQLKAQAEDTTRIKAAEAQAAQKKVDLDKTQELFKKNVATKFELDHAKLDVTIAELSLVLAQFQQAQDKRKYEEAQILVDRMTLKSPIPGRVEQLYVERGESVDALEKVARVVRINPLWVDAPVPLGEAKDIRPGHAAKVTFDSGDSAVTVTGKVIHVAAVADAASGTRTVRLEVANDFKPARPAGERVKVSFPGDAAAVKAGQPGNTDKKAKEQ
jgi:RND family efflux transporter MFP subunit